MVSELDLQADMVVVHIPTMQLQDELTTHNESLIFIASVPASAAKQSLVPSATGLDVVNAKQRCKLHVVISHVA